jgi:hypothetical protein
MESDLGGFDLNFFSLLHLVQFISSSLWREGEKKKGLAIIYNFHLLTSVLYSGHGFVFHQSHTGVLFLFLGVGLTHYTLRVHTHIYTQSASPSEA